MPGSVVVLAGGTGGAKLARGLSDLTDDLVVVANTGDDVVRHGAHVSPDPDLCVYWLADRIDARGWGLADDTFAVMDGLRELGDDVWFNLGDRDLAVCLHRARRLAEGATLTTALAELTQAFGITEARVLPMTDDPVRTRVSARGREWGLQEFLIQERGAGPIENVRFDGVDLAAPTAAVLDAIAGATAVIIGPSNPIISIGPILAVPGMREAIAATAAPVVAVSPIVEGRILKGPTAACLAWAGHALDAGGIADCYAGLIDGLVTDATPPPGAAVPALLQIPTRMDDPERRRTLGAAAVAFAATLRR